MSDSVDRVEAPRRAAAVLGWVGGWAAVLALAAWMHDLSPWWLAAAGAGTLLRALAGRPGDRAWRLAAAAALGLAVIIGAGVQFRLGQVAGDWGKVRFAAEERASAELKDGLDELFDRGSEAVDSVAAVAGRARRVSGRLFERVEEERRAAGVTALAVFEPDGSPLVWAGEHRGTVPGEVRAGLRQNSFSSGPLFGYVYFARPLENGRVAMAAVLVESHVAVDGEAAPYAEAFAARHGLVPRFTTPELAPRGETVWDWETEDQEILSVYFGTLTQERWRERVVGRGRWAVAAAWLLGALLLAAAWYRGEQGAPGVPIAVLTLSALRLPLERMAGGVFSPAEFVVPWLPADVSLGQLLVVLAGAAVWLLARPRASRPFAALPLLARAAAAAGGLWLAVEVVRRSAAPALLAGHQAGGVALVVALALLAGLPLLALLSQGDRAAERHRTVLLAAAVLLAGALALAVVLWWRPGRGVPVWTAALWAVPFTCAAAVLPRASVGRGALLPWVVVGWIGGTLSLSQLWTLHLDERLEEAELQLTRLGTQPDPLLEAFLGHFAEEVLRHSAEGRAGVSLLYQAWTSAGLAREGYEARLTLWQGENAVAELRPGEATGEWGPASLPPAGVPPEMVPGMLAAARAAEEPLVQRHTHLESLHYLLAVALPGAQTVSVAVPPRRHLGSATALARFLGPVRGEDAGPEPATLSLVPAAAAAVPTPDSMRWVRTESGWRSEAAVRFPSGPMHAHLLVDTPALFILVARGLLAQVLVLAAFTVLWALARTLCGEPLGLASAQWVWFWSFRGRLTLSLFVFFLLPMAAFGATAYRALSREGVRTAGALAGRALDQAAAEVAGATLSELVKHVGADLLLYHRGELAEAAYPEVIELGLYHTWLSPRLYLDFTQGEAVEEREERRLGGHEYLLAYHRLAEPVDVLASPTPLATGEVARRQRELADVVLLAVLAGAALSVVLSLLVGRAFSRPIEAMSQAAARVGEGDLAVRLPARRRDEFGGLYRSFNRMVRGLRHARGALLRETRRTEAIVAEAGTGVVALDASGRVALINPRAEQILGAQVPGGARLPEDLPLTAAVGGAVRSFLGSGAREWTEEVEVDGRVVRLRLRRLPTEEGARGAVLVLEDVTAEIRSARVLAWGEMARQVAHEIKNPLTPIKLAVQHIRRAHADGRDDFGTILDRNVESVLREIDRLGEIARAFSRFGTPDEKAEPLELVDVRRVAEETLALYRGGVDGIGYTLEVAEDTPRVHARVGELKEVLVNLLENARGALGEEGGEVRIAAGPAGGGAWVRLDVTDTGEGIPPESLPRIFEPKFSTKTSGTGLGLAIVRRLVDSWGAEVTVDSVVGEGTTVHLRLRAAGEEAAGAAAD